MTFLMHDKTRKCQTNCFMNECLNLPEDNTGRFGGSVTAFGAHKLTPKFLEQKK